MNAKLSPLELLKKFLKEQPKEKIDKIINELDRKKYEGLTVNEYFSIFDNEFHTYYKDVFYPVEHNDYVSLWASLTEKLSTEINSIERIKIIDVISEEEQDFTTNMPSIYALAA